ncbi:MAG TPA: AMP-binding protein [Xanthobacteraceae bacterium]|nr:AMP-binding protein [Xanthobacteraceae bacterium]
MDIVDAILFQCRRQPPAAAICVPGQDRGLISYRRLEQSIHNVSRRLLSLGVPRGSVVAVEIQDVIVHAVTLLALTRLGVATLSVSNGIPPLPVKIDALITDVTPPASTIDRVALVDGSWMEGDGPLLEPPVAPTDVNDPSRIMLTSGSTGMSAAIAVSQRLLSKRVGRHLTVFGNRLPRCDRLYCDMPISTSLGFQFLIYSLLRGGTIVFPGERFDSTLLAIEEYKVQCLIASPEGLEAFVQGFSTFPVYQSSLELIVCCGSTPSALLDDARLRICSHLVSAYHSAEAGTAAAAGAHELAGRQGAVGFVTPGTTIQIVDQTGTVLPPGQEGLVRIKSDTAVEGYLGGPEETAKSFHDGWFYPGDFGVLDPDGLLTIADPRP